MLSGEVFVKWGRGDWRVLWRKSANVEVRIISLSSSASVLFYY